MFNNLTERLSTIINNIKNHGRLTEDNITETLRKVRIALLEADVALPVIHKCLQSIKIKSLGKDINKYLTPGQEFIKIVQQELIYIMGVENYNLNLSTSPPAVILVIGVQGVGKTTTTAKLGKFIKNKYNKKVLTVSTDIYRPAAIQQLEILTKISGNMFFVSKTNENTTDIIINALKYAKLNFLDVLIIDTPGCLHNDTHIIKEIQKIYQLSNPIETLFILDSMIGQDAIHIANSFNKLIPFTGVILTKIDSDTRGGVALSIREITGKPIKFVGTGENVNALEPFYPERIASRILGMGDILSLIEEIEYKVDKKQTEKLANKLKKKKNFDLNDYLKYIKQIQNMGGITNILNKLPTTIFKSKNFNTINLNDKTLIKTQAIINSMTLKERENPIIIKGTRKKRIAQGAGTQIQDVNTLLKQFYYIQRILYNNKKGNIQNILHNIKTQMPSLFKK